MLSSVDTELYGFSIFLDRHIFIKKLASADKIFDKLTGSISRYSVGKRSCLRPIFQRSKNEALIKSIEFENTEKYVQDSR